MTGGWEKKSRDKLWIWIAPSDDGFGGQGANKSCAALGGDLPLPRSGAELPWARVPDVFETHFGNLLSTVLVEIQTGKGRGDATSVLKSTKSTKIG